MNTSLGESVDAGLKSYERMKDSGVEWLGDVPAHWDVRRLRNVANVLFSNVDKHSKNDEIAVRLCNYSDVYHNDSIHSGMSFMQATANADEIERFRLHPGDVLITKDSESWDDIGVPALVQNTASDIVCGYHLALLRPISGIMNGSFLHRALTCPGVAIQFFVRANGVTRFGLSQTAIKSCLLPCPPPSEQAAFALFLDYATDQIKRHIRAKEKLIALLEEQKQAIIHDAVTGRIDVRTGNNYLTYKYSGVKSIGHIPEHWDVRPAKWHFREVDERSVTGSEEMLSVSHLTGITPRSQKNVTMFEAESNIGHKICKPGDIVINTMWAWMGALGLAKKKGIVSPSYAIYRKTIDSLLSGDYGEILLRSKPYQTEYQCLSTGIHTSRLRLYPETFLRINLICPSPREQDRIVRFVQHESKNFLRSSELVRKEITLLKEYRTRLIADVLKGKIDAREAARRLPR